MKNRTGRMGRHRMIWSIAEQMEGQIICPSDIAKKLNLLPIQATKIIQQKFELKLMPYSPTRPTEYLVVKKY